MKMPDGLQRLKILPCILIGVHLDASKMLVDLKNYSDSLDYYFHLVLLYFTPKKQSQR
jgi:hypothetical protein